MDLGLRPTWTARIAQNMELEQSVWGASHSQSLIDAWDSKTLVMVLQSTTYGIEENKGGRKLDRGRYEFLSLSFTSTAEVWMRSGVLYEVEPWPGKPCND